MCSCSWLVLSGFSWAVLLPVTAHAPLPHPFIARPYFVSEDARHIPGARRPGREGSGHDLTIARHQRLLRRRNRPVQGSDRLEYTPGGVALVRSSHPLL